MAHPFTPRKTVDATEAKNSFGSVARSTADGPVEVTLHGKPEYVIIKLSQYRELVDRAFPPEELSVPAADEFERLVARQGASLVPGDDPLEGVTDEDLHRALRESTEAGGRGR